MSQSLLAAMDLRELRDARNEAEAVHRKANKDGDGETRDLMADRVNEACKRITLVRSKQCVGAATQLETAVTDSLQALRVMLAAAGGMVSKCDEEDRYDPWRVMVSTALTLAVAAEDAISKIGTYQERVAEKAASAREEIASIEKELGQ